MTIILRRPRSSQQRHALLIYHFWGHMPQAVRFRIAGTFVSAARTRTAWLLTGQGTGIFIDRVPALRTGTAIHRHHRDASCSCYMSSAGVYSHEQVCPAEQCRQINQPRLTAEVHSWLAHSGDDFVGIGAVIWRTDNKKAASYLAASSSTTLAKYSFGQVFNSNVPLTQRAIFSALSAAFEEAPLPSLSLRA